MIEAFMDNNMEGRSSWKNENHFHFHYFSNTDTSEIIIIIIYINITIYTDGSRDTDSVREIIYNRFEDDCEAKTEGYEVDSVS